MNDNGPTPGPRQNQPPQTSPAGIPPRPQQAVPQQPTPAPRASDIPAVEGAAQAVPTPRDGAPQPGATPVSPSGTTQPGATPPWMTRPPMPGNRTTQATAPRAATAPTDLTGTRANATRPPRGRHRAHADGAHNHGEISAYARQRISVPRWFIVLVIAAVLILAVAVITLSVRACSSARQPVTPATEQQWVSPYDWDNLKRLDNGFLAYYNDDGSLASEAGVDVSEHDGEIDWQAVKAAGADFAMIRLGYRGYSQGTLALDDYFLANIKGASDAGLKVGVYFFSQAISADEAREEAQYVIDTLAGLGITLAYPVAFDQEPITNGDVARTDNITNQQLTANALAFCQAIEQAGYQAMVYGNQHDLARLDLSGELGAYPLWYAEYEAAGNVPTGEFDFTMWQYTASGTVDGMPTTAGQVDMNIRFLG